jgi:hypothetical protein
MVQSLNLSQEFKDMKSNSTTNDKYQQIERVFSAINQFKSTTHSMSLPIRQKNDDSRPKN